MNSIENTNQIIYLIGRYAEKNLQYPETYRNKNLFYQDSVSMWTVKELINRFDNSSLPWDLPDEIITEFIDDMATFYYLAKNDKQRRYFMIAYETANDIYGEVCG